MTLNDRFIQLMFFNGHEEQAISKEELLKRYNEAINFIDNTKEFQSPEESKFNREELNRIKDSLKKLESQHSAYELLGGVILNEFNLLQNISKETPFPNVLFRKMPTNGINAHAIEYPEGFLVIIEKNVDVFYQVLIGIICRSKTFQVASFGREICDSLSHEETVVNVSELFENYLRTETISDALYFNSIFTPKDGAIMELWGFFYRDIINYIIAHELSHIYLDHHSFDKSLKSVLEPKGLYPRVSQSMELSADKLSFQILFRKKRVIHPNGETWESISSDQSKLDLYLLSFYSSNTIYFNSNNWIDKIWEYREAIISGKEEIIKYDNKTHPPDLLRQLKFMEWIHGAYPDIIKYSYINEILKEIEKDVIPIVAKSLI